MPISGTFKMFEALCQTIRQTIKSEPCTLWKECCLHDTKRCQTVLCSTEPITVEIKPEHLCLIVIHSPTFQFREWWWPSMFGWNTGPYGVLLSFLVSFFPWLEKQGFQARNPFRYCEIHLRDWHQTQTHGLSRGG